MTRWRLTSPLWLYEEERQLWSGKNGRSRGWSAKRISVYKSSDYKSKKNQVKKSKYSGCVASSYVSESIFLQVVILYPLVSSCVCLQLGHICVFSTLLTWAIWGFESVQEVRVEGRRSTFLPPSAVSAAAAGHQSQMWPTTDSDTIIRSGRSRSFNHWQITRITVNPMPLGG